MVPILPLTLISLVTGVLGTGLMLASLALPTAFGRRTLDPLATLGSLFTKRTDAAARSLGAVLITIGGVGFAVFYALIAWSFMSGAIVAPEYRVLGGFPTSIDLFYPLLGLVLGFSQGVFASLILAFVVVDHHPIASLRDPVALVQSFLVGNTVFGMVVMFLHHQLLQLVV